MLRAKAEVVAHAVAALLVRRRVDDRGDDAALDKLGAHADEKIPAVELGLAVFAADFDVAAAGKQNRDGLRIFRRAREKISFRHARARLQRDDLLRRRRKRQDKEKRERGTRSE